MLVQDTNRSRRLIAVMGIVCAVLQLALAPNVALASGHFNFCILFAGVVAAQVGGRPAIICGFLSGLFYDLSATSPIGLMAFLLTLGSALIGSGERSSSGEDSRTAFLSYVILALAVELIYGVMVLMLGQSSSFVDAIFLRALPSFLLDCLAYIPYYILSSRSSSSGFGGHAPRGSHLSTRGL